MTIRMWPDCSDNQATADGKALLAAGCTALAAKASQGSIYPDKQFAANYAQAKAVGLDFIAYHYLDTSDGAVQAQYFAGIVDSVCGTTAIGLMVDWERVFYPNGPIVNTATINTFLERLAQLAPKAAISVYTSAWVVEAVGSSSLAVRYPLVWPSYVTGTGDPGRILRNVTPSEFPPFGGWTDYSARQFTDSATAGGFSTVDFNVCFSDEAYDRLVSTPTPAPSILTEGLQKAVHETVDGIWGPATDAALELVRSAACLGERPDIKALQTAIGVTADGVFGPESQAALTATVEAIQRALGNLAVDGVWGRATDARFAIERRLLHKT